CCVMVLARYDAGTGYPRSMPKEARMTATTDALTAIRKVRQTRRYAPDPIDPDTLREILEVARWSGSAANTQPWHFVVVDDPDELRQLSEVRDAIGWVSTAPVAIAIVL